MNREKLNFPSYAFRFSLREGQEYIWDALRGSWLRCTPEEWVRQHVIRWLEEDRGVITQYIVQEYPVSLQGMPQRADIVVMGRDAKPLMLVECKAPGVKIDQGVFSQAVRYNSVVGATYIMITNGLRHYFYRMEVDGRYRVDAVPNLAE